MCRTRWIFVFIFQIFLLLVGCGEKDAKSVVNDLSKRSEKMESYMSHGKLTIQTGQEPQVIDIEVWYKKPHYYRVALKNTKNNITQILLRNDEGVYVLTPSIKKSFRFQSDWPESSGQIYLYQSILSSIIDDQKRQFQKGDKEYLFEVASKHTLNQNWKKQKVWLDQDLNPKKVSVLNAKDEVMVEMVFDRFKLDASFDQDAFDMQRNLNHLTEESKQTIAGLDMKKEQDLASVVPAYIPMGSRLDGEKTVQTIHGPAVIVRYAGAQPFTIVQKKAQEMETYLSESVKPVMLYQGFGILFSQENQKQLKWLDGKREFELTGNLPEEEMVKIANSFAGQPDK
ncbi:outer membrane lipoprotein-sorting protein [Thermoflavimicrobium dichotomicum]|uniref:Outer membrane lipoprotein-sorting protein n=1 Tax=Thermoflavimicrobium dichotomicum TaxID=46223 RepID=A0A1I3TQS3_9BACL|nr:DUF4367 domain-containing protein [Thermoflavimicrobium dichotomicum]SFJ73604.1 Outer membrane lipoprotein-sorting protein [Thermoflavimicrobium dichotomicum]